MYFYGGVPYIIVTLKNGNLFIKFSVIIFINYNIINLFKNVYSFNDFLILLKI